MMEIYVLFYSPLLLLFMAARRLFCLYVVSCVGGAKADLRLRSSVSTWVVDRAAWVVSSATVILLHALVLLANSYIVAEDRVIYTYQEALGFSCCVC